MKARNSTHWLPQGLLTAVLLASVIAASGCGKTVELGDPSGPSGPNEPNHPGGHTGGPSGPDLPDSQQPNPDGPTTAQCAADQVQRWHFTQPDATLSRVVDLLFVVDTSASLDAERKAIAAHIPDFLAKLEPGTDYRIAVMLGHGGKSTYSGALYSATGRPKVLKSTQSLSQIQADLRATLADVEDDEDEANGEALMYSLMRSLEPARVARIQAQGFYRPGAALSVVFVADENDICFPPEKNGFTQWPDYVASAAGWEKAAYDRYCSGAGPTGSAYPRLVRRKLMALKKKMPVTLASITHVDPARVPRGSTLEDAIGHGYIELVRTSPNGVLIDIADPSYASGLARLGGVVQSTLKLQTRFELGAGPALRAETLGVAVDGKAVRSMYDEAERAVEIALADAGKARSSVDVAACVMP